MMSTRNHLHFGIYLSDYKPFALCQSSPHTCRSTVQLSLPNNPSYDSVDAFVVALMATVQHMVASSVLLVVWLNLAVAVWTVY